MVFQKNLNCQNQLEKRYKIFAIKNYILKWPQTQNTDLGFLISFSNKRNQPTEINPNGIKQNQFQQKSK